MMEAQAHSVKPAAGLVPDAGTAIAIAEAVSLPVYGKTQIDSEKPLRATLQKDVWLVTGTLHGQTKGGVVEVEISREDGRILRLSHGK